MGGIGKVDPRDPLGRDGDRADRGVERVVLEALEDRIHLRDGNEAVLAPHDRRRPAREIDAHPVDRSIRLDQPVRRRVIDGDRKRQVRTFAVIRYRRAAEDEQRRATAADRPKLERPAEIGRSERSVVMEAFDPGRVRTRIRTLTRQREPHMSESESGMSSLATASAVEVSSQFTNVKILTPFKAGPAGRARRSVLLATSAPNIGQFGTSMRELGYTGTLVSFEPVAAQFAKLKAAASGDPNWIT